MERKGPRVNRMWLCCMIRCCSYMHHSWTQGEYHGTIRTLRRLHDGRISNGNLWKSLQVICVSKNDDLLWEGQEIGKYLYEWVTLFEVVGCTDPLILSQMISWEKINTKLATYFQTELITDRIWHISWNLILLDTCWWFLITQSCTTQGHLHQIFLYYHFCICLASASLYVIHSNSSSENIIG